MLLHLCRVQELSDRNRNEPISTGHKEPQKNYDKTTTYNGGPEIR